MQVQQHPHAGGVGAVGQRLDGVAKSWVAPSGVVEVSVGVDEEPEADEVDPVAVEDRHRVAGGAVGVAVDGVHPLHVGQGREVDAADEAVGRAGGGGTRDGGEQQGAEDRRAACERGHGESTVVNGYAKGKLATDEHG